MTTDDNKIFDFVSLLNKLNVHDEMTKWNVRALQKALSAGMEGLMRTTAASMFGPDPKALSIESLDGILKTITFDWINK